MKKLFIAVLVTLIGLAFTAPAFAIEHEFGGYWRTRMFTQKNFDGSSDQAGTATTKYAVTGAADNTVTTVGTTTYAQDDISMIDSRSRLYYTAVINDNLKFVNKFEMDADWGDGGVEYGDIGADGVAVEVKNSYVDFNLNSFNVKIGTQGLGIQRGFIFSDDTTGVAVSNGALTALYFKFDESSANAGDDESLYGFKYLADLDTVKLTPTFTYLDQADGASVWYLGLDVDATISEATSLWGTFIYNGGDDGVNDVEAFLGAGGFNFKLNDTIGLHGQAFYASGDDSTSADQEAFQTIGTPNATGTAYYWAEIMGLGYFDDQPSVNSPGAAVSNIFAANLGVSAALTEKMSVKFDLWYAALNEVADGADDDLGVEADVVLSYQLVEGLSLNFIAAYLFAGDATNGDVANQEDPWEVGTQLSLSF